MEFLIIINIGMYVPALVLCSRCFLRTSPPWWRSHRKWIPIRMDVYLFCMWLQPQSKMSIKLKAIFSLHIEKSCVQMNCNSCNIDVQGEFNIRCSAFISVRVRSLSIFQLSTCFMCVFWWKRVLYFIVLWQILLLFQHFLNSFFCCGTILISSIPVITWELQSHKLIKPISGPS